MIGMIDSLIFYFIDIVTMFRFSFDFRIKIITNIIPKIIINRLEKEAKVQSLQCLAMHDKKNQFSKLFLLEIKIYLFY